VANPFTQEHRAALDWLNEVTRENINFFGLEVELWRIGDSMAAPKFNVVSEPNDWSESISSATTALGDGSLTETKQMQRAYWTALAESLTAAKSILRPQKPLAQNWTNFALGRSNIHLVAVVNTVGARIGAHVVMIGPSAKWYFSQLEKQREAIEKEFGEALEWRELPGKKESQIGVVRNPTDPAKVSDWPVQHAWMRDTLERLHKVFSQRAKALQPWTGSASDDVDSSGDGSSDAPA
jgi:hypothetical protein